MCCLQSYTAKRSRAKHPRSGTTSEEMDIAYVLNAYVLVIEACILRKTRQLSSGQLVQIKDGPFIALEAVFMREMSGSASNVLLRTLAFQARIVLEMKQLTPYVAA
jgi:hypothetical protein